MIEIASGLLGVFLIGSTLRDVFQSVIVPRAVNRRLRLSFFLTGSLWKIWPVVGFRMTNEDRRENFFGTYAPFALVCLLAAWVVTLIAGYGMLFYALHAQMQPQPFNLWTALYFAGTTLLTIGFGDYTGRTGVAHVVSLAAGISGLSVVAVVTAFLFSVFGAFQKREVFVTYLGERSGAPPSGLGLLSIACTIGILDDLPQLFLQGQLWTAEVLESHLAYPILAFFRSSHDYESWVGALGTLLDAGALLICATESTCGQAQLMYWSGNHLVHDLVKYFGLVTVEGVGIERYEFAHARERLRELGFKLTDEEQAWKAFSEMRSTYAPGLAAMANFWRIPPLQWIGDRSIVTPKHVREVAPARMPIAP
ncbi:MAG: potassium channel family protein [Candidatus Eremiobacteraeota bacterium]|nr:potassium channel family protein [Candidatus Eremiobacteraeota bacterium]